MSGRAQGVWCGVVLRGGEGRMLWKVGGKGWGGGIPEHLWMSGNLFVNFNP